MYAGTLLDFFHKLGVADQEVMAPESPGDYTLEIGLPAARVQGLTVADLNTLLAPFGEALTLKVGQRLSGPQLLEIDAGQPRKPFSASLRDIQGRPGHTELRLQLALGKPALLRQLALDNKPFDARIFIFASRLAVWLKQPLHEIEGWLFSSPHKPAVIVVTDLDLDQRGPLLCVVGLGQVASMNSSPPAGNRNLQVRVDSLLQIAKDNPRWHGFTLDRMTPSHFLTFPLKPLAGPLGTVLIENLLHLCILYTANRSIFHSNQLEATYASSEETVTLALVCDGIVPRSEALLLRLSVWPFGGRDGDRVSILRSVVARELETDGRRANYQAFVANLEQILSQARWHYKVFVDRQIDKHFEQVEKATDFVNGTAKEVSQSVDAITKGLSDSLLAAVGLVVLTLLATLIKELAHPALIGLALKAYVVYLVMFQLLYRMGSILHSYLLIRGEARARRKIYSASLGSERVNALFAPLKKRGVQFWIWYLLTVAIYAGVALFLWWVAMDLAGILTEILG